LAHKTPLETLLEYGIDEKNRIIHFGALLPANSDSNNEVNQYSIEVVIRAFKRMVKDHPKTPIEIHMNSYGGDPYAMLALHDLIQSSTCQVKFYGSGAIMSAASWVMVSCDERHLFPNTTIMVHDIHDTHEGHGVERAIGKEECDRLMDTLNDIYAKNSRMDKKFWQEVTKRDLYITADEAITLGLADKIVHPKKRGNLRKVREYHLKQNIDKRRMNRLVTKLMKRIHAPSSKVEITVKQYVPEEIDERLVIEPIKEVIEQPQPKDKDEGQNS
jgi:ATP-dependent protease ClpP protease subunit